MCCFMFISYQSKYLMELWYFDSVPGGTWKALSNSNSFFLPSACVSSRAPGHPTDQRSISRPSFIGTLYSTNDNPEIGELLSLNRQRNVSLINDIVWPQAGVATTPNQSAISYQDAASATAGPSIDELLQMYSPQDMAPLHNILFFRPAMTNDDTHDPRLSIYAARSSPSRISHSITKVSPNVMKLAEQRFGMIGFAFSMFSLTVLSASLTMASRTVENRSHSSIVEVRMPRASNNTITPSRLCSFTPDLHRWSNEPK